MAKLRRLKIEKFRNVAPGTELRFHDGYNVLLGQNGTGKTSLLKLISMALSSDFSELEEEAFAIAYEIETTQGTLSVDIQNQGRTMARGPSAFTHDHISVARDEMAKIADWSYRTQITGTDGTPLGRIDVSARGGSVTPGSSERLIPMPVVSPFNRSFLSLAFMFVGASLPEPEVSALALIYNDALALIRDRFDEALGFFDMTTGGGRAPDMVGLSFVIADNSVTLGGARSTTSTIRVPHSVVAAVQTEELTIADERVTLEHGVLPFFAKTIELCGFVSGRMTLVREHVKPTSDGMEVRYGNFAFNLTLDDGTIITHRGLSYGQKRLLSFLYHLALNEDVVIADELVNGLHYDWIEACIEQIGDRQAFLTSQNPVLLDFLPFSSAEEVQRSFLLCRRERTEGGSVMVWKNLDAEPAEELFRSYRTKALQVSEILRMQGLW